MNKEEIHLLKIKLFLNYYKKDITDDYIRCVDNIVLDDKVLNSMDERLYITTLDKHNDLQQRIDKAIKCIDEYKEQDYSRYYENEIEMDLIDDIREILGGKE